MFGLEQDGRSTVHMRYQDCAEQGKVNGLRCLNVVANNCMSISVGKTVLD